MSTASWTVASSPATNDAEIRHLFPGHEIPGYGCRHTTTTFIGKHCSV